MNMICKLKTKNLSSNNNIHYLSINTSSFTVKVSVSNPRFILLNEPTLHNSKAIIWYVTYCYDYDYDY